MVPFILAEWLVHACVRLLICLAERMVQRLVRHYERTVCRLASHLRRIRANGAEPTGPRARFARRQMALARTQARSRRC